MPAGDDSTFGKGSFVYLFEGPVLNFGYTVKSEQIIVSKDIGSCCQDKQTTAWSNHDGYHRRGKYDSIIRRIPRSCMRESFRSSEDQAPSWTSLFYRAPSSFPLALTAISPRSHIAPSVTLGSVCSSQVNLSDAEDYAVAWSFRGRSAALRCARLGYRAVKDKVVNLKLLLGWAPALI